MDTTNRPLNTLDPSEVDAHIDATIDQLFVPKVATPAAQAESSPARAGREVLEDRPVSSAETTVAELEGLHEILLSLEWEVSERNIRDFEGEIRALGEHFAEDRHVKAVVQMALGVGKYLRAVGEGASPLGVQFPTATLHTLEILLRDPAASPAARKVAVEKLLDSYRRLQSEVRRQPAKSTAAGPKAEGESTAVPPLSDAAPARPGAQVPAAAEPVEELEPETARDEEELEPEAVEELEPTAEEATPDDEQLAAEMQAGQPPAHGESASAAGAPPHEVAPEPQAAREPEPPPLPEETVAVSDATEALAGEPAVAPAFAETPAPAPTGQPAEPPRDAALRLVGRLGTLRTDVREGLDRAFRAASAGAEELDAELTEFRHLLDEGLASALDLAEGLVPALEGLPRQASAPASPAQPTARLAADLEQVRQALEGLTAAVRDIEGRLAQAESEPAGAGATRPKGSAAPLERPETPPAATEEAREVPAYLVSVGGRRAAIPVDLLANAYPITQHVVGRISERGYATVKDFRRPFRSLKSGLTGPLAALGGKELERLRFPLIQEPGEGADAPCGAVLLSDGKHHSVLLTDEVLERTPRPAPESLLFHLGAGADPGRE